MFQETSTFQTKSTQTHQIQTEDMYTQDDSICGQSGEFTSSDDSFCLQGKIQHVQTKSKLPTTHHLITNLAYKLKSHNKRNQYLRARLDTFANVNIMPASAYKLVFQDPDIKKFVPSKSEIGTYTINTVKLFGSCTFYLVHSDTKEPQEVTFYMASNNGSVLLSCTTTLHLAWYSHALDWTIYHLEPA